MIENVGREIQKINIVITTRAAPHETAVGDLWGFKAEVRYLGDWI